MTDLFFCEFWVAGLAKAQPRAHRGRGGHIIASNADDPVLVWREGVRAEAQRAMAGRLPRTCALQCDMLYLMPRSKALEERLSKVHVDPHAIEVPHEDPPDADNLLKSAWDALKMVPWTDDCKISRGTFYKRYTTGPECPGLYVRIIELKPRPWTPKVWDHILTLIRR